MQKFGKMLMRKFKFKTTIGKIKKCLKLQLDNGFVV